MLPKAILCIIVYRTSTCYYYQDYSDHTKRKLPITPVE